MLSHGTVTLPSASGRSLREVPAKGRRKLFRKNFSGMTTLVHQLQVPGFGSKPVHGCGASTQKQRSASTTLCVITQHGRRNPAACCRRPQLQDPLARLKNLKLFETREASLEPQEEVAEFRDAVCLGNLSHRKVSLLRRF